MTFYVDSCLITARRRVLQVAQDVITTFYLLLFRSGQSFMVILLWYVISCVGHFLIIVTMCLLELIKIYFSQCLMILDRSAEHDTSKRSEGAVVSHVWRSLCLTYCTLTAFATFSVCYAVTHETELPKAPGETETKDLLRSPYIQNLKSLGAPTTKLWTMFQQFQHDSAEFRNWDGLGALKVMGYLIECIRLPI